MLHSIVRTGLAAALAVPAAALAPALSPAAVARAGAWDVFNNANALASVAALDPYVWAPSLKGLHRYDPATQTFQRYFREPRGLRSNAVRVVSRDAAGAIWIGTAGAGASLLSPAGAWSAAGAFEGLPSDDVTALEPHLEGMWVGTKAGLAFFIGTEIQAVWPDGANPSPFGSNVITDLVVGGGRTWVATEAGVYATEAGVTWDSVMAGLTTRNVRSLAYDSGRLWAVTADGRVWSGGEGGSWTQTAAGLAGAAVALGARGGLLHLGAADGVYRWDGGAGAWVPLGGPSSAAVDAAGDGTVWAGSAGGLWELTAGGWVNRRSPGPQGNWINGMALDGSTVYMTSLDGGVARYDDARGWRNFLGGGDPDTSLLSSDYLFACLVDREGYKWFGDWGHAISRLDDSGETPRFVHFFPDTAKFSLAWASAHDPEGPRWFGLDTGCKGCEPGSEPQGLLRIDDDGTRTNYLPTNSAMTSQQIRALAYAPDGTMWVGYADLGGVDLFSDRTLAVRSDRLRRGDGLRSDNVWGIVIRGASAWVATDGGVTRFALGGPRPDSQEVVFTPVVSQNGAVNPLAVDGRGNLWLGTQVGLFRYPPGGPAQIFNVQNSPLVSNDVHSVVLDEATGDLWIGTGEGVNRLRPRDLPGQRDGASGGLLLAPNPISFAGGRADLLVRTSAGTALVRTPVEIHDLAGRRLARLRTDGRGVLSWDGRSSAGRRLAGGVYFLRALVIDGSGTWVMGARGRLVLLP